MRRDADRVKRNRVISSFSSTIYNLIKPQMTFFFLSFFFFISAFVFILLRIDFLKVLSTNNINKVNIFISPLKNRDWVKVKKLFDRK